MNRLPSDDDFCANTVTEGQYKSQLKQLLTYLRGLLGGDGNASTALTALGIPDATNRFANIENVLGNDGSASTARIKLGLANQVINYNNRGAWAATASYNVNDLATNGSIVYVCQQGHVASTFATDLAAGKWTIHQGITREELASQTGGYMVYHKGRDIGKYLENVNGGIGLKKFVQKLHSSPNANRLNVRLVGTSIAQGSSVGDIFGNALAEYFGKSNSLLTVFAGQAANPISGWKAQYYSGSFSNRLRGGNGDGALPLTYKMTGKSVTVFYSTESDGGSIGVTTQTANGAVVSQAAINCAGATSLGNAVTYTLDPNFVTTLTLTPPSSGYGYLEYFVVDAGDYGMMFSNLAYGGSALGNHAGTKNRVADTGMYPTATPSGNLGLIATFAPTHAQVKPDLLIYSGPTNDAADTAAFATNLMAAVALAVANGTACILIIEPLNGSTSKVTWDALRAAFYATAVAYPDSVFIYDFDAMISPDLAYNPKFHASTSDPHPGDYGYGNPHTAAGSDLCARLGVPFQRKLGRKPDTELARTYTQAFEPLNAVVGSIWYDTSNDSAGVRKKLISRSRGMGTRGLWACETGDNKIVHGYDQDYLITGSIDFGSRAAGVNFLGDPCVVLTGQTCWSINFSDFVAGKKYTFSYLYEAPSYTQFNTLLCFGSNPFFTAKAGKQAFVQAGSDNVSDVTHTMGAGDVRRFVCTVTWPTAAELAAALAAGINTSTMRFTIQAGSAGNPLSVWGFRVEEGACVTNNTAPAAINKATAFQLSAIQAAAEPLGSIVPIGNAWIDTSNTPSEVKHLVQADVLNNLAKSAPGIFGQGISLWRAPSPHTNLLDGMLAAATITTSNGGTVTTGNYGPGSLPGLRFDTGTGNGNNELDICSALGAINMARSTVYTLSFLARCGRGDNVLEPYSSMSLFLNLREYSDSGNNFQLQTDLVSWANTPGAWKFGSAPRDQAWHRHKLTFKTSATAVGGGAGSNKFVMMLLTQNISNQWVEITELRLEIGAGVTVD